VPKKRAIKNLVACASISNGALAGDAPPSELKIFEWGSNTSLMGDIKVGQATLKFLDANQKKKGFDRIGLDYEHQSLPGHPNYKPAPREYAAYWTVEVREGDGVYLIAPTWIPEGFEKARNFHDLSPVVLQDENGEVIFIHSVALCPQGAVEGLQFFSAPEDFTNTNTYIMNEVLRKLICALFGAAEDADDEALLAAGKEYLAKLAAAPDPAKQGTDEDD